MPRYKVYKRPLPPSDAALNSKIMKLKTQFGKLVFNRIHDFHDWCDTLIPESRHQISPMKEFWHEARPGPIWCKMFQIKANFHLLEYWNRYERPFKVLRLLRRIIVKRTDSRVGRIVRPLRNENQLHLDRQFNTSYDLPNFLLQHEHSDENDI